MNRSYFVSFIWFKNGVSGPARCRVDYDAPICDGDQIIDIENEIARALEVDTVTINFWRRFEENEVTA